METDQEQSTQKEISSTTPDRDVLSSQHEAELTNTPPRSFLQRIQAAALKRKKFAILGITLFLLLSATGTYAFLQKRSTPSGETVQTTGNEPSHASQSPQDIQNNATESALGKLLVTPTPSSQHPNPTTKPSPSPSPLAKTDLHIDGVIANFAYNLGISNPDNKQIYSTPEQSSSYIPMMQFGIFNNTGVRAASFDYSVSVNNSVVKSGVVSQGIERMDVTTINSVPLSRNPGRYAVSISVNQSHALAETNYDNNTYTFTYEIIADTKPPEVSIDLWRNSDTQKTCVWYRTSDNVSQPNELEVSRKIDNGSWVVGPYQHMEDIGSNPPDCIAGPEGEQHTYTVRVKDARGNVGEATKQFALLGF